MQCQRMYYGQTIHGNHRDPLPSLFCRIRENEQLFDAWCLHIHKRSKHGAKIFTREAFPSKFGISYRQKSNALVTSLFQSCLPPVSRFPLTRRYLNAAAALSKRSVKHAPRKQVATMLSKVTDYVWHCASPVKNCSVWVQDMIQQSVPSNFSFSEMSIQWNLECKIGHRDHRGIMMGTYARSVPLIMAAFP